MYYSNLCNKKVLEKKIKNCSTCIGKMNADYIYLGVAHTITFRAIEHVLTTHQKYFISFIGSCKRCLTTSLQYNFTKVLENGNSSNKHVTSKKKKLNNGKRSFEIPLEAIVVVSTQNINKRDQIK